MVPAGRRASSRCENKDRAERCSDECPTCAAWQQGGRSRYRGASRRETSPHGGNDLPARGDHAECGKSPAINHCLPIDQNLVFGVSPMDHLDLDPELATQLCRHPDGVQSGDSIGAVADTYSGHRCLLSGNGAEADAGRLTDRASAAGACGGPRRPVKHTLAAGRRVHAPAAASAG